MLLKCSYNTNCLPGGYSWACVVTTGRPKVWVNDSDDSYCEKYFDTIPQAVAELQELKLLAPFNMWELKALGYTS